MSAVRLPAASPSVGRTVRDLEALGDGGVTVAAIIREGYRRYVPAGYWPLFEGDILVLEADTHALSRLVDAAGLELIHGKELVSGKMRQEDLAVAEAVVTANSIMIGNTVEQLTLRERFGLNLLAISRSGGRIAQRLRRVRFQEGNLLVLQGRAERVNDRRRSRLPASGRAQPAARATAQPVPASGDPRCRDAPGDDGLVSVPGFIISDNATSLDVTVQAQVLELMRKLVVERGTSLLFITRDIGIAAHFCDRVAVIYAGEIMELAARDEFFENPQHPYTLLLLAAFSHNEWLRRYWLGEDETRKEMGPSPTGCPFANRCVRVQPRCRSEHPSLRELAPHHFVCCHFPVER
jgi:oligopeptide/dipeptide ABC transporter ATP-binding protein